MARLLYTSTSSPSYNLQVQRTAGLTGRTAANQFVVGRRLRANFEAAVSLSFPKWTSVRSAASVDLGLLQNIRRGDLEGPVWEISPFAAPKTNW